MERYEVKVKYEQIKDLMDKQQYQSAMDVCNTIDWDKSKNINMLCLAGEVYERCGMFEDSKEIYLRAYQFQPKSRIVICRLAELSIKLRDYEDSIHFYKEYQEVAPYDANLYVLRYKIYLARGASNETLISILEELKETDYHEHWAYELARLYGEAGMIDKCVAECDEINLWFGEGRYVLKALQLKKRYQPLTRSQQAKLDAASPKPYNAAETMKRQAEAAEKQLRAQQRFEDSSQEGQQMMAADREYARKQALDASREARAAQLLQEAEQEAATEDAALDEQEERAFIGQGLMPEFKVKVPQKVAAPRYEGQQHTDTSMEKEADDMASQTEPEAQQIDLTGQIKTMPSLKSSASSTEDTPSESDILAQNIALALGGKLRGGQPERKKRPATGHEYEDDFIDEVPVDDFIQSDIQDEQFIVGDVEHVTDGKKAGQSREVSGKPAEQQEAQPQAENVREEAVVQTESIQKKTAVQTEDDGFVDDYEQDNPVEDDDTTPEDEESFRKKESAFRRMFRKSSGADAGKKEKKATVIAPEQNYDIQIKPVVVSRYDTINLQKELARSIRAIMSATEKEEVEKTMETIDRSMEESNIQKLIQTKRLRIQEVQQALEEEEKKKQTGSLVEKAQQIDTKMQRLLDEEYDGQMRIVVEEEKPVEKQITGQMNLADLFRTEDSRKLEDAKKKALECAEEYIDQLSVVVPYIGEREEVVVEEISEKEKETLEKAQELMDVPLDSKEDLGKLVAELSRLLQEEGAAEITEAAPEDVSAVASEAEVARASNEAAAAVVEEAVEEAAAAVEAVPEEEPAGELAPEEDIAEAAAVKVVFELEEEEEEAEAEAEEEEIDEAETEVEEIPEAEAEVAEEVALEITSEAEKVAEGQSPAEVEEQIREASARLEAEQRRILSYFMKFSGVEDEITAFLERDEDHGESFVITGTPGCGRTSLALRLMKALAKANAEIPKKVAKLPASSLKANTMDAIFTKIGKGTLIIEHAEEMTPEIGEALVDAMDTYAKKVRMILIGEQEPVEELLSENDRLSTYFAYCFHLHEYNNNELVEFAKAYADTKGYSLDEMAVLALYTRLAEAKTKRQAVMLGDVKEIVNQAIAANESRKGLKNFFESLLVKKTDEAGNLILREQDFEEKSAK